MMDERRLLLATFYTYTQDDLYQLPSARASIFQFQLKCCSTISSIL